MLWSWTINAITVDLVDHISPWLTLLVEASDVINIWLSWEGMVGKWRGAGTEPNTCTIWANQVEFSTLVGEYSVWLHSIGNHNCLETVFLYLVYVHQLLWHHLLLSIALLPHLLQCICCQRCDIPPPSVLPTSKMRQIPHPLCYWWNHWWDPVNKRGLDEILWWCCISLISLQWSQCQSSMEQQLAGVLGKFVGRKWIDFQSWWVHCWWSEAM